MQQSCNLAKIRIVSFFNLFSSRGHNLYQEKIRSMCEENKASFEVDYNILASECQVLAYFLPEAPTEVLAIFDEAVKSVSCPDYRVAPGRGVAVPPAVALEPVDPDKWCRYGVLPQL
jgi:DNA replicative helicase MCM subunit Mcm2 (Cdc46/Mcm family)